MKVKNQNHSEPLVEATQRRWYLMQTPKAGSELGAGSRKSVSGKRKNVHESFGELEIDVRCLSFMY